MELCQRILEEGRISSYGGETKRAHGEEEAQRPLGAGLKALKVGERQLQEGPGMAEKQVLSWSAVTTLVLGVTKTWPNDPKPK